jgi:secondary thiamine-phosphate synthase enzyme
MSQETVWFDKTIRLKAKSRGFHLVTDEVVSQIPELKTIETGMLHIMLQHTSASLTINENADPAVRSDMEMFFNRLVPEQGVPYEHIYEGADDITAHIKSSIIGCQLTIPVQRGQLVLGQWQGICLGEHRNHASERRLHLTIHGTRY